MIVPFEYRTKQIEQIMFRNAAMAPHQFKLNVKTDSYEFESTPTFEHVIVSHPHPVAKITCNLESMLLIDDR